MYDNYYDILGVENFSTIEEIRKRFKSLMKTFHPDKCGDSETFLKIKTAYDLMTDISYKENYDRSLKYLIDMNERAEEVEVVHEEVDNQTHFVCSQCMGVNWIEKKNFGLNNSGRNAICEFCSKFYKLIFN